MIHSPRQRRYLALSAFLGSFTRTSRAPKPRQHGLTFKLFTALFAVMAVLVGTAAAAFANAANPLPHASGTANVINGNVTQNANGTWTVNSGTVDVQVGGTWNWGQLSGSSPQSDCTSRYGVGWAVDWAGNSNSASAPGALGALQIKSGGFFHIFDSDMVASGNVYKFTGPCTPAELALDPNHPSGPWSATHTYTAGQTIPQDLCVNMYDMHGKPGSLNRGDQDPLRNNDNSIKTNSFDPGANKGNCFIPIFINTQHLLIDIYDCTTGTATTTEVVGTVSASGPSTVASQNNPVDDATVKAGAYTVNATAPADYHFVDCGKGTNDTGTTATHSNVNVPVNSTGKTVFYVAQNPKNPNLTIHKSANATTVTAGDSFNYTLDVANTGDGASVNTVVTDTIPTGLAITKVTPSVGSCTTSNQDVSCSLGTLAKAATASIVITVKTSTAKCGTVTNTGTVKADNNAAVDSNPVDVLIVCPNPGLEITKSASATTVTAGDSFDYTLVVRSTGAAAATAVTVTDDIPAGLSIVGTPTSTSGDCSATSGQHVSCAVGDLAAANANSGTKSATIVVHVSTSTAVCGKVTNTGHAAASNVSTVDSNPVDVTIDCPINGNLVKGNDADRDGTFHQSETADLPGMDVPFQVTLTNTSAVPVVIESIDDSWSTDVGSLSIQPNCDAAFIGQTVAPGASLTCSFTVQNYSPAAGSSVTNTATVTVHDKADPSKKKTVHGTSVVNTAGVPPLSLTVVKTNNANGDNVFTKDETGVTNASVDFRVSITNNSAVPVTIDSVTDVWPDATEFAPACAASIVGTTLDPGDSVSCDFTVANYVPASTAGPKTNTVTVKVHQPGNPGNTTTQKDTSTVRGEPPAVLGETVVRALPRTGSNTMGLVGIAILLLMVGLGLTLLSSGRIPQAALALRSSALVAPAMYIRNVPIVERNLGRVSRRKLT